LPVLFHAAGGEFVDLREIGYGMRSTFRGHVGLWVALAGASRVSVASEAMQRLAPTTTERIPLGVSLDRWPVRAPRRRDPTEPIRLLHVGDIRPVKDQTTLIHAVAALADMNVSLTLDMAGLDTLGGALRDSQAAARLGNRVRWHGVLRRAPLR